MIAIDNILEYTSKRYSVAEYPVLAAQLSFWQESKPFQGLRILDGTPLYSNTLLKYLPLLAGGANLTVGISSKIPYDPQLPQLLKQWNIPVVENAKSGEYDCILDCGGAYAELSPHLGSVELTRSGFYHYVNFSKPVILVDDSRIKTVETCLGTGDGFMRGMAKLGYTDWNGRNVVIFGYGKVGRGVAYYCHRAGALVTAVDNQEVSMADYVHPVDKNDHNAIQNAVKQAWCVVTATGIAGAMRGNGAAQEIIQGKQLVAAIGIEDEWGDELPLTRRLANGKTINFMLDEPTQVKYIDPTMALSNAAALELCKGTYPMGINRIDKNIENIYWNLLIENSLIKDEIEDTGL